MPQAAEHVTVVKTGQREEAVQEKHEPVVEAVVRETLEKTPEKTLETRMEEVCVEAFGRNPLNLRLCQLYLYRLFRLPRLFRNKRSR